MRGIARDLSIVQWAGRRATLRTVLYGSGALAMTAALGWLGLTHVVTHAEGSLPDEVRADIVVPLAGTPDRRVYANVLVEQGVAASSGSTLIDMRCLQPGARHIRCATGIRNTIDEAVLLKRIFEEESIAHAIIVTSSSHLARASAVFSVIFAGTGIDLRFVSPPDVPLSTDNISREVKSYLPSLGGAVLARLVPSAYEWVRLISPVCPDALRGLSGQSPV